MKDETKAALPEGWRWVKLGEVCELIGGGTPSRSMPEYFTGNTPWVTPTDINKEQILVIGKSGQSISEAGLKDSSAKLLPVGTVMLTSRAGIGSIAIAGCELTTNQGFINFVCGPEIDNYYLAHWLRANVSLLNEMASGTTFKEISRGTAKGIKLVLPPIEEQEEIVRHLRHQFVALHEARAAAEAQLETLKMLPAALLRAAFNGTLGLTVSSPTSPPLHLSTSPPLHLSTSPPEKITLFGEAHKWPQKKLGEVCDFLNFKRIPINAAARSKRIAGKIPAELYPYYGANGQAGWIDDFLFDETTILLAEDGGNFGSLERPIAYKATGKYWVNNHAHILRPKPGVDLDFVLLALTIRPDIGSMVSGSTRGKLNQEIASTILIPMPPLAEQRRIALTLNHQLTATAEARAAVEAQLANLHKLPASLLRQAFAPVAA